MGSLLFYFLKIISYLPFWFWHGVADILWVLSYFIFGYRKKVVMENLDIAFPEKTTKEKKQIARKFYRNFSDFIIESIKAFSMSGASFRKRYHIDNIAEVLNFLEMKKQGAVLSATHSFSWEWMIHAGQYLPPNIRAFVAFTPLSNKSLNKLITANRQRFGLELIRSNKFAENLKNLPKGSMALSGLVADQSPFANYKFRTEFFGVNVPVFTGPERLARELNQSLWFMHIRRTQRSHYVLHFEMIAEQVDTFKEGELTKIYIQKTEELIRKYPDNYLWTHRRWKHR